MSDASQGHGWWQATDGKWYPPEAHPNYTPTLPPQTTAVLTPPAQSYTQLTQPVATAPRKRKKPLWKRWWAIAILALIVIGVIAAIAAPPEDEAATTTGDGGTPAAAVGGGENFDGDEAQAPAPALGSRDNPVPLGQPTTFTMDTFGDADDSVWTLTVDAAGSDITQAVADENQFNEPPADGTIFYGVPITLTLDSAKKEPLSVFINLTFEFFGPSTLSIISDGFSEGCGVTPGAFDEFKEVFVGGSVSGVVCYEVTHEDVAAGVMLTLDDIKGDRVFLATR